MLETIWFILWGVIWVVYFMLDGFDLGLGTSLPILSKTDEDRRIIYNAMGPFWDGNEVWLITAGGATFAAFPAAYAVMFSSLYTAMMLLLFALIFRGISFEFRSKVDHPGWRKIWDGCMTFGSLATTILLGVAFANLFKGLPLTEQGILQGGFFTLLKPYGLLGGVFFLVMFMLHGSLWLIIKSSGDLAKRATNNVRRLWPVSLVVSITFVYATLAFTPVLLNFINYPVLWIVPFLGIVAVAGIRFFHSFNNWYAWFSSCGAIVLLAFTGIIGMYPNLIRSTIDPAYSMTIQNSSSSPLTLKIMLGVAIVCVPIVIVYQTIVYRLFRHKVTPDDLLRDESY